MGGLYQKALYFKTQDQGADTIEEDSGLPPEELLEIRKQIESVVAQNKNTLTKELLTLHPQKKGILFPLLNLFFMIGISVALFLVFQQAFIRRVEGAILPAQWESSNTESVLARVQKESQQQLQNKEKEISEINDQLKVLGDEKDKLQVNMEKNIEDKKRELADLMEKKIEEEKKKLLEQGIAVVDIDAKVAEMRKSETDKFTQNIESYKLEEENKRKQAESKLSAQITSIQTSLTTAQNDMDKLKTESAAKEKELQQKLKEQEAAQKLKDQDLVKAEETIKKLGEQRANEQMIEDQIDGFYNSIIVDISKSDLVTAKLSIQKMKEYFDKPEILALPSIAEKRDKNLFLVNALEQMIKNEEVKQNIDYASLYQKADIINNINTIVRDANELYKQNDLTKAKQLYEEAIAFFPEIKDSYLKMLEFDASDKKIEFKDYVLKGDEFYKAKDFTNAITSYKNALKVIPQSTESIDTLVKNIQETGYQLMSSADQKINMESAAEKEKTAKQLVLQADALYTAQTYTEAIDKYLEVLSKYPQSSQIETAKSGIKKSFEQVRQVQQAKEKELSKSISDMESALKKEQQTSLQLNTTIQDQQTIIKGNNDQLAANKTTIDKLTGTIKEKDTALSQKDTLLADNATRLKTQDSSISDKNKEIERLKGVENTLQGQIEQLNTKLAAAAKVTPAPVKPTPTAEAQHTPAVSAAPNKDLEAYNTIQERIAQIKSQYTSFTQKEDSAILANGSMGYLSTRPMLGEILTSDFISEILPDIYHRIKAYEDALVEDALKAGNDQAMETLLETINAFYNLDKNASKTEFWKNKELENKNDSLLLEVFDELESILK